MSKKQHRNKSIGLSEIKPGKLGVVIVYSLRALVLLTVAASIIGGVQNPESRGDMFMNALTGALFLAVSFVPSFMVGKLHMILPATLQTVFIVFSFFAMYLGEIANFYERFEWWDTMLHSFSGVMLGLVGFWLVYSLNRSEKTIVRMNDFSICAFAFCFAVTMGALWEMFEYACDYLMGFNMQKGLIVTSTGELAQYINKWGRFMDPGLMDTMEDMIVDALGALLIAIIGYISLRRSRVSKRSKSIIPM